MSIGSAFSNALSGLRLATTTANVISNNIANAQNPDYGRQGVEAETRTLGGVLVRSVARHVDPYLQNNLRHSEAGFGYDEQLQKFQNSYARLLRVGDADHSLTQRFASLEAALIEASSRPDQVARLERIVDAAQAASTMINDVSEGLLRERQAADQRIGKTVGKINANLEAIQELNLQIIQVSSGSSQSANLKDRRDRLIDEISKSVPLQVVERKGDQVSLYTKGGATLLEHTANQIEFSTTQGFTVDARVENNDLARLKLNGHPVDMKISELFAGGTLAADFAIRDEFATGASDDLDTLAKNLISTFSNPDMDKTLIDSNPGLFTDNGGPVDASKMNGLASRLSLNARVDPKQDGAIWRIRDGIGAASPGATTDATLLLSMKDALYHVDDSSETTTNLMQSASIFLDSATSAVSRADNAVGFSKSVRDAFLSERTALGVEIDTEMQMLLAVQDLYSANAKIIQTIDEMIETLIRI